MVVGIAPGVEAILTDVAFRASVCLPIVSFDIHTHDEIVVTDQIHDFSWREGRHGSTDVYLRRHRYFRRLSLCRRIKLRTLPQLDTRLDVNARCASRSGLTRLAYERNVRANQIARRLVWWRDCLRFERPPGCVASQTRRAAQGNLELLFLASVRRAAIVRMRAKRGDIRDATGARRLAWRRVCFRFARPSRCVARPPRRVHKPRIDAQFARIGDFCLLVGWLNIIGRTILAAGERSQTEACARRGARALAGGPGILGR